MLQSKQTEALLAVAETGSFELAAEKLNITASAVTLRVQSLEKFLGHILIIRERPCRVNQAGRVLLQHLQHARLLQQNLIHALTGKVDSTEFCKISIATNADSLATWLLPVLQQSVLDNHITLELKTEDQSQTYHLLETGLVNACISTENQPMKGCVAQILGKMRYRMVATPEFCQKWFKNGISRETLKNSPAVIYNHKDQLHQHFMQQHYGLMPNTYPCHFIPSSVAFMDAIQLHFGFGLLPELQIQDHLKTGALIEIIPEAQTDVVLYWHHWKRQLPQLEQLTIQLIQKAQHILNQMV